MRPYYATLVCGKASPNGEVEICNAGHCPPLLMHDGAVTPITATGLPVGMFCQERYETLYLNLNQGDRLLLYTDGLSEARDGANQEYGARLYGVVGDCGGLPASNLVTRLIEDMHEFSLGAPASDDLTVMAIEMAGH